MSDHPPIPNPTSQTISSTDLEVDERAELTKRVIPEMRMSTAENGFTRPVVPGEGMGPEEVARWRFGVEGNAVVTGGTGTLALASARALLEHGLSGLALWDVNPTSPASSAAISSLQTSFPKATIIGIKVDVRSPDSISTALTSTLQTLPTINILCCFAGVVSAVHALTASFSEWQKPLDVNLTGSFLCAQAFARHCVEKKHKGSIVFIASISGHTTNFPQPQASYNASKAGVLSLTKSLAAEWAGYGIRVNSVSPGYMDTVLNEGDGLKRCRELWMERCPLGRMGVPWEVGGLVVFLVSRGAGYVSGSDFGVDGGMGCFFLSI